MTVDNLIGLLMERSNEGFGKCPVLIWDADYRDFEPVTGCTCTDKESNRHVTLWSDKID